MRIEKAQHFGAAWTKKWNSSVTHIIVDRNITFADVMRFLKVEELPVRPLEFLRTSEWSLSVTGSQNSQTRSGPSRSRERGLSLGLYPISVAGGPIAVALSG